MATRWRLGISRIGSGGMVALLEKGDQGRKEENPLGVKLMKIVIRVGVMNVRVVVKAADMWWTLNRS